MQTINPGSTQLFCKPSEKQTKTKTGILLADNIAEKPQTAEVINIGSKVTEYIPKDIIVYKSYATTEIKLNGDEYLLISEEDILGKIVET